MRVSSATPACARASKPYHDTKTENRMSLGLILLVIIVLLLLGAVPAWPHSRGWGYAPSGGLGLVLVILIVLVLLGYVHI
jgi:uncharacterized protein DUF3309